MEDRLQKSHAKNNYTTEQTVSVSRANIFLTLDGFQESRSTITKKRNAHRNETMMEI